jgi:hypothetical protein
MAVEEAAESCGSHAAAAGAAAGSASPPSSAASGAQSRKQQQQQRHKLEVYTQVLRRLQDGGVPEGRSPGFEDELWCHFNRLPARYVLQPTLSISARRRRLTRAGLTLDFAGTRWT